MRGRSRAGSVKSRRRKPAAPKRPSGAEAARSRSSSAEPESALLSRELAEARQQQTATADVLRIISSSSGELEPVFSAILENATRLCQAKFANLFLVEGEAFRNVALHGAPPTFIEARRQQPLLRILKDSNTVLNRMAAVKKPVQIEDIRMEPSYRGDSQRQRFLDQSGARTVLGVPLLRDNELVGGIAIYRQEVRPFGEKQIALVQNFAAQAVIAIENARLPSELRQRTTDLTEALEQQTATADVLSVISSSPGNLEPVFQAMLEKAVSICNAKFGTLFRFDGSAFSPGGASKYARCACRISKKTWPLSATVGQQPRSDDENQAGATLCRRCCRTCSCPRAPARWCTIYRARTNAPKRTTNWRSRDLPSGGPTIY